ncbi:MAG: tryptophan--tRNA ligase [Clostridia bacterium]|nr:tryptophan--tRNA ligase [Clostridia bacterium]
MQVLYSATKPTGKLTLGNYIGAISKWCEMQNNFQSIFAVADLHSLTVNINSDELRENIYTQFATFLACGLDSEKCIIYCQSQVKEHAELAWIMNCLTYFGEASRMTQFKDQKRKKENVSVGLFAYPMLMTADILLYHADVVPVGIDQMQHVEICRDIAERFNSRYGETFTLPKGVIPKTGAKIMGLTDPTKKMSKSEDNDNNVIYLSDDDETIMKKFKRAVTDSLNNIKFCKEQPGVSNLLTIYSSMRGISIKDAEKHFENCQYGELKMQTAKSVIEKISPIRNKVNELKENRNYLDKMMKKGAEKASEIALKTLKEVYEKVGLVTAK